MAGFAMAGALAAAGSLFLPWARSGRAVRSGFELANTVDTLGLADALPQRALLVGIWCTPLLAALAWTALVLRRWWVASALIVAVAVLVGAAGIVMIGSAVDEEIGTWIGIVTSIGALGGGLCLAYTARQTP